MIQRPRDSYKKIHMHVCVNILLHTHNTHIHAHITQIEHYHQLLDHKD